MPLRLAGHVAEHFDEGLERVLARLHADLAQRPRLVEANMIPGAGKQFGRLRHPIAEYREHPRVAGIKLIAVAWQAKVGELLDALVALDPSLGTGSDPAAIQIFEANSTTQIGEWKHNKTDIPGQIKLITQINTYIVECTKEPNNLYYSIENNSIGEAALISLNEYGEQNIPGNFISEPGKKRRGFNTNRTSKLAACSKFKTLLESKKMSVNSYGLISELKAFVAFGGSYAAKQGDTDDLVMATLLIVRMLQQLSNFNYDLDEHIRDHDNIIEPLPFFAVFA